MNKEKLTFFKKAFLVVTDFRSYPFLIKHEKFRKGFELFLHINYVFIDFFNFFGFFIC